MDETQNQAPGDKALHPPLPSSEVDELREQVRQHAETILRQERMFQKACKATREAELRAERAETLLDSKREILDGSKQKAEEELQKRLSDLYTQLEGARRSEEDLSTQLEVERRRRIDAERKTDAHKVENVEWKRREQEAESGKEALLQQIERLKGESEKARKEAKDLKNAMKKKYEVFERENKSLKEQIDDERKKNDDANRDKESLLRQIEKLNDKVDQARREAEDSKKKLERENSSLKASLSEAKQQQNSRSIPSVVPSHPAQQSTDKSANSSYREIKENEFSEEAKIIILGHNSGKQREEKEIIKEKKLAIRNNPRARSLIVEPNIYGVEVTDKLSKGDYIAELFGYVCLPEECTNRDLVPMDLNDHTFLGRRLIIDARKCGNFARNLRKSCKPNARLWLHAFDGNFYCFIVAIKEIPIFEEVSIKLDDDWRVKPRPAQGCACKDKETCELERFFNKKNTGSTSRGGSTTGETKDGGRKRKMSDDADASTSFGLPTKKTAAMEVENV